MTRVVRIALSITLIVGLFGAYRLVSAQNELTMRGAVSVEAPATASPNVPLAFATNHVLQRTYFSDGNQNSTVFPAGTFTAVDSPQSIQCPGTAGTCTITADMWVETGLQSAPSNNFAICAKVDGNFIEGGNCFYSADTPTDNTFVTGTRSDHGSGFGLGAHTVQTFLFPNNNDPVQKFNVTYHVYRP